MTGFFSVPSHLSIFYACFVNGALVCLLFSRCEKSIFKIAESRIVFSFLISLLINGLCLFILEGISYSFTYIKYALPLLSLILICNAIILLNASDLKNFISINWNEFWRISFYGIVFILLLFNGGLIEQISDAWWHMSLANKMSVNNSLNSNIPHLNGVSSRYYPPLWHGNLIVIQHLSNTTLPNIWNAFTPWGAALKTMAFFLFAVSLVKNYKTALLCAVLFVCLPGAGNSYMRVAAWPSHIAYTAMFTSFFLVFKIFDNNQDNPSFSETITHLVLRSKVLLSLLITCCLVMYLSHKAELLWAALAFVFYGSSLSIYNFINQHNKTESEVNSRILYLFCLAFLGLLIAYTFINYDVFKTRSLPLGKSYILFFVTTTLALIIIVLTNRIFTHNSTPTPLLKYAASITLVALLLTSIDFRQLTSLALPNFAHQTSGQFQEEAIRVLSNGEQYLSLPNWKFGLRSGLLYSGLLGLILSLTLVFSQPTRATIFVTSTAFFSFLMLISPYWYQWLLDTLKYHSPWRVSILIFHPIIIAVTLRLLWLKIKTNKTKLKCLTISLAVFCIIGVVVYDTYQTHLNANIVTIKRQHQSAQRNWNVNFHRKYVINDSSLRYEKEFKKIIKLIEPKSYVYSDLATSYYAASHLPVFIKNTHRHQGALIFSKFRALKYDQGCNEGNKIEWATKMTNYLSHSKRRLIKHNFSQTRYLLVNKDTQNMQVRPSCFMRTLTSHIQKNENLSKQLFNGDYFILFELN